MLYICRKCYHYENFRSKSTDSIQVQAVPDCKAQKKAEKEHESLNSYVESILEKHVELEWPQITADFKVSDLLLSMNSSIPMPSKEELEEDPRMAHILGYVYED
jgi:hypothetical protein